MHHDILRDVCSDKHLSIIVVVHPVLCTDRIADWIWAYKLAIDNALHLKRIEQVHHAQVCITAAGLVRLGIAGSEHWP